MIPFELSTNLNHTWIFDLDGTIFKHNGYLDGTDELLPNVKTLFESVPIDDYIIILTARSKIYEKLTLQNLNKYNIRYDKIIFDIPTGERILINDIKPQGLNTALCWNITRDKGFWNENRIITTC